MGGCKLTRSLDNKACAYALSGARALYLANYFPPVEGEETVANAIAYQFDADGYIEGIHLPEGEAFYKIECAENTLSFTDALTEGGNGGKFRTHTVNAVINQHDLDTLNEGDALSLGRFVAVVVDSAGKVSVLGRTGGLSAPAGGFDYNTGAAEADATGWTLQLAGSSTEIAKLLKDVTVITPVFAETVEP